MQIFNRLRVICKFFLPSGYAPGQIKICICPKAIPQAIYSTIFALRSPRRRLRLCLRENKNLHIPAGYAESILLHNICLQGYKNLHITPKRLKFRPFFLLAYTYTFFVLAISNLFSNTRTLHFHLPVLYYPLPLRIRTYLLSTYLYAIVLTFYPLTSTYSYLPFIHLPLRYRTYLLSTYLYAIPQALPSGYAPGQIKICIFPQAIPQAIFSTIFALRSPRRRLRLCPRANKNLHILAGYAQSILLRNICLQEI
ncbi:hypothetical protein T01_5576 [Trichinella spiralis]|uniref:Uncharacterized protein n=1 Tax=Trichinella spiralis TaxID=6334 RepID=A0A0V1BFV3_TRISP|nr:hypothetical protein T01_5576 [Trichinella spiralis]